MKKTYSKRELVKSIFTAKKSAAKLVQLSTTKFDGKYCKMRILLPCEVCTFHIPCIIVLADAILKPISSKNGCPVNLRLITVCKLYKTCMAIISLFYNFSPNYAVKLILVRSFQLHVKMDFRFFTCI